MRFTDGCSTASGTGCPQSVRDIIKLERWKIWSSVFQPVSQASPSSPAVQ